MTKDKYQYSVENRNGSIHTPVTPGQLTAYFEYIHILTGMDSTMAKVALHGGVTIDHPSAKFRAQRVGA